MASLLGKALTLLRAPANELAFGLRARLTLGAGPATLPHEDKGGQFDHAGPRRAAELQGVATELRERFALGALHGRSTKVVHAANLALLDRLQALANGLDMPHGDDGSVRAVDVGSGDFHYATALARWLSRHGARCARRVDLLGVELDANGLHRDGHTRADHARAHAQLAVDDLISARFVVGDFRRMELPAQDVATCFFPFVFAYPLLRWGLPLSKLRPRALLRHAVRTVRPGGWLVMVNQTRSEFERAAALLEGAPVTQLAQASFANDFVPYADRTVDRVGSIWRRS